MNTEKRGSEKLMESCTGLTTLSTEELEQIGGGALSFPILDFSPYRVFKIFPYGIVDPDVLQLDKLKGLENLGRGF